MREKLLNHVSIYIRDDYHRRPRPRHLYERPFHTKQVSPRDFGALRSRVILVYRPVEVMSFPR